MLFEPDVWLWGRGLSGAILWLAAWRERGCGMSVDSAPAPLSAREKDQDRGGWVGYHCSERQSATSALTDGIWYPEKVRRGACKVTDKKNEDEFSTRDGHFVKINLLPIHHSISLTESARSVLNLVRYNPNFHPLPSILQ